MDDDLNQWFQHDEIVLWYEHDLFDQLILIRLLDYLAQENLDALRLSFINVEKYAVNPAFFGLGQLSPDELKTLFAERETVSREQLSLARGAWQAFTSPDPREIEKFLRTNSSALPFLRAALIRFLQEFPSVENGLSRTEHNALTSIQNGAHSPADVFRAAQHMEAAPFCGDTTFFALISELARGENPLFENEDKSEIKAYFSDGFQQQRWVLTTCGERVLNGETDNVALRGINKYLGGAHLSSGATLWRWNDATGKLTVDDRIPPSKRDRTTC